MKRWAHGGVLVQVDPGFDRLRYAPPHLLLGELKRACMVALTMGSGCHFEGLAQAAKFHRGCISNRQAAKLRLIDDAFHLVDHLTPESCTAFLLDIQCCAAGNSNARPPPPPDDFVGAFHHGNGNIAETSGQPEVFSQDSLDGGSGAVELQPDALDIWYAGKSGRAGHSCFADFLGTADEVHPGTESSSTQRKDEPDCKSVEDDISTLADVFLEVIEDGEGIIQPAAHIGKGDDYDVAEPNVNEPGDCRQLEEQSLAEADLADLADCETCDVASGGVIQPEADTGDGVVAVSVQPPLCAAALSSPAAFGVDAGCVSAVPHGSTDSTESVRVGQWADATDTSHDDDDASRAEDMTTGPLTNAQKRAKKRDRQRARKTALTYEVPILVVAGNGDGNQASGMNFRDDWKMNRGTNFAEDDIFAARDESLTNKYADVNAIYDRIADLFYVIEESKCGTNNHSEKKFAAATAEREELKSFLKRHGL